VHLEAVKNQVEVGTADGLGVERLVVMQPQGMLPQHSEQQRPNDAIDDVLDVHWPELAVG